MELDLLLLVYDINELMLKYSTSFGENFYLTSSINATTLNNKVTKVNNSVGFVEGGSFGVGQQAPSRMEVGFPIGYFYTKSTPVFRSFNIHIFKLLI